MDRIVAYLRDYTAALTFAELPGEVVHHAKRMLIDTLGCAIGGFTSEPSLVARALAGVVSSQQPATVLGSGQQTSLDLATFANGVLEVSVPIPAAAKASGHKVPIQDAPNRAKPAA